MRRRINTFKVIAEIVFLLCAWNYRLPGKLIAWEEPTIGGLIKSKPKTPLTPPPHAREKKGNRPEPNDPAERMQYYWEMAQARVEDRYLDQSIARQMKTANLPESRAILTETAGLIEKNFYRPIEPKIYLLKALLQLEAALESGKVRERLGCGQTQRLKAAVDEAGFALAQGGNCRAESLARFTDLVRGEARAAGVPAAWPELELAYALAGSLDRYSCLMNPEQYRGLTDRLEGHYLGVGLDLIFTGAYPTIFDVVPGSPAADAGIISGDTLLEVNGHDCRGQDDATVANWLCGEKQSRAIIKVRHGGEERAAGITRRLVVAPSVRYARILDEEQRIGFVRVASFDHETAIELKSALEKLQSQGVRSLIIDLRSNGGGVMGSAIDAVRLFLDRGTIVTVKTAAEITRYTAGGEEKALCSVPLALLVDENTASAAEIFASALRDNGRARLIGRQTLGKGVVQSIYPLKAGGALCLTTAVYIPPSGVELQEIGLEPEIITEKKPAEASMALLLAADDPMIRQATAMLSRDAVQISKTMPLPR